MKNQSWQKVGKLESLPGLKNEGLGIGYDSFGFFINSAIFSTNNINANFVLTHAVDAE